MWFTIFGRVWKVYFVPADSVQLKMLNGKSTLGMCDSSIRCIFICQSMSKEKTQEVLQHEIAHAFFYEEGNILPVSQEENIAVFSGKWSDEIHTLCNYIMGKL